MKKGILVGCLIAVFIFFSCGEDSIGNQDSTRSYAGLTYSSSNMLVSGQAYLNTAVDSFTSVVNEDDKALLKALADCALFPVGFGVVEGFNNRMKEVFLNNNRISNVHSLLDAYISGDSDALYNTSIASLPARRYSRFITGSKLAEKAGLAVLKVGLKKLAGSNDPLICQLCDMGIISRDTFQDEVRQKLNEIVTKIDALQQLTAQVLHEVSLLHAEIPAYINCNSQDFI